MKKIVFKYYLISFLTGFYLSGPIIIPFFTEWGGLNQLQIQFLQSWFMLVLALSVVPTGVFADRFGRRKSMVLGLLLAAIANLWYASTPNPWIFISGEALFALHVAFIVGADRALLTAGLKKEANGTRLSSILATSFIIHLLGLLIANPIGRQLAEIRLNLPMQLTTIPMLLAAAVTLTLPESKGNGNRKHWWQQTKDGLAYLTRHPQHAPNLARALITSTAGYFVIWLYPAMIGELTESLSWLSWALALLLSTEIGAVLVFRHLSDTHQHHFLRLARWLTTLGFLAASLRTSPLTIAFFIITSGAFGLSYWDMYQAELQQHLPEEEQATISSGANALRQAVLIVMNPLVGWLANQTPLPALILLTVLATASLLTKPRSET